MSRKSDFAKSTAIISIGTFLPKFASIITLPILTGCLTKEEYGQYDLITVLVSLLLPALTLQMKSASFRFLLDVRDNKEMQKKYVTNIYAFTFPVSVVALLVLFFVLPGFRSFTKLMICGYYLADILVNTARQISRGIGNNLDFSISAIISAFCKMLFAVIFVWYFKVGLAGAATALFLASLLSFVYIIFRIKLFRFFDFSLIDKNCIKELLKFSWPMVPNELSLWVMSMSDRFVVTSVMGITMNAVLAASTKIPSLINLAQSALSLAWQENAAITAKEEDSAKYYTDMFHIILRLQAAACCAVIAGAPILFKLLVKGSYEEAYYQIPILCHAIFFSSLATFLGGIYVAFKATKNVGVTTICAAAVNLVVNLGLINFIGLYAASISTFVSYLVLFLFRAFNIQKLIKITFQIKQILLMNVFICVEIVLCYQQTLLCNVINAVIAAMVIVIFNRPILVGMMNSVSKIFKKLKKGA